jgi:hypothetical protein
VLLGSKIDVEGAAHASIPHSVGAARIIHARKMMALDFTRIQKRVSILVKGEQTVLLFQFAKLLWLADDRAQAILALLLAGFLAGPPAAKGFTEEN